MALGNQLMLLSSIGIVGLLVFAALTVRAALSDRRNAIASVENVDNAMALSTRHLPEERGSTAARAG